MQRVVFGAGICTLNHWKYIKKYFKPDIITDNAERKWGHSPVEGISCEAPEQVFSAGASEVLISVGDPYNIEQIKIQLAGYDVTCTTIYELIEKYSAVESVPERWEALGDSDRKGRVLLFNTPEHNNIGDHLIAIAEERYIKDSFPGCEYLEVTDVEYLWHHKWLREHTGSKDIILVTGGGFLGSLYLYNGELNVRNIISEYPENKIVIFPQTMFFEENERGGRERDRTGQIYGAHTNLTLCLREKNSYQTSVKLFENRIALELMPDIALSLDFSKSRPQCVENKIGICLRHDKESLIGEEGRKYILDAAVAGGYDFLEMSMRTAEMVGSEERVQACERKIEEIRSCRAVVTDALHCMISCVITGTPCIAIDNTSHKVRYMYEWVKNLQYVNLLNELSCIGGYLSEMVQMEHQDYDCGWYDAYKKRLDDLIREV